MPDPKPDIPTSDIHTANLITHRYRTGYQNKENDVHWSQDDTFMGPETMSTKWLQTADIFTKAVSMSATEFTCYVYKTVFEQR